MGLIWAESTALSGGLYIVRDGIRIVLCSGQCVQRGILLEYLEEEAE